MAAAVLILWMCYYVHIHNTSHHPAVREGLEYEGVVGGVGDAAETSGTSAGGEGHEYEQVGGGEGEISHLHGGWRRRRESTTICNEPASSVLFDGKTPTLTGLSGDMWASQLFTLSSVEDGGGSLLSFEFDTTGFTGVWGVEVTMFNCPDWGLAVQSITLQNGRGGGILSSNQVPSSCTSLVTDMLCSQSQLRFPESRLMFDLQPNSDRVCIAEVTFSSTAAICETGSTPFPLIDITTFMQPATTPASSAPEGTTRAETITPADTTPLGSFIQPDSPLQTVYTNADLNTTIFTENNIPTSTIILAAVLTGVLIAMCILAAVLIPLCQTPQTPHQPSPSSGGGAGV